MRFHTKRSVSANRYGVRPGRPRGLKHKVHFHQGGLFGSGGRQAALARPRCDRARHSHSVYTAAVG